MALRYSIAFFLLSSVRLLAKADDCSDLSAMKNEIAMGGKIQGARSVRFDHCLAEEIISNERNAGVRQDNTAGVEFQRATEEPPSAPAKKSVSGGSSRGIKCSLNGRCSVETHGSLESIIDPKPKALQGSLDADFHKRLKPKPYVFCSADARDDSVCGSSKAVSLVPPGAPGEAHTTPQKTPPPDNP